MAESKQNPLLVQVGLPLFSTVRAEHLKEAVSAGIERCRRTVLKVTQEHALDPTWDNVMTPLEEAEDYFSRIWSVASHLNGVRDNPEYRQSYEDCLQQVSDYQSWVGQYRPLYDTVLAIKNSDGYQLLTAPQRKALENTLRDFHLSGVDLDETDRARYQQLVSRLSTLETTFSNHVLDATQHYILHVTDREQLKGLPRSALELAAQEARNRQLDGYVFTLQIPSYLPFITYAENRELRETLYKAYQTRASEVGPDAGQWDNAPLMEEILKLRHELARLLGFESYAHYSLATKMAKDPAEVLDFLHNLAERSKAQGQRELEELKDYARAQGAPELEPWDLAFWSERLRKERYAYDAEALREYFPVDKVLSGLFECTHRLYQVSFRPHLGVDVWHDEVRFYDIYDEFGGKIGSFYLDLFARQGKRGGAWMDECLTRRYRSDGALQLPVTYIECNFTPPVGGRPSLLTHDEVETLFHEFGHALNQLLTRIDIPDVSGINGVPWDAVELPSQFNENFTWNQEVLGLISANVRDGTPLPEDKLHSLLKARNFHSAMAMLRQLEFALFDFRVHLEYDKARGGRVMEILGEVKDEVAVIPQYPLARFPHSFTHIFSGGYAAGYYSYKWAEVLAADAFGRLEEEGLFSQAAREFRDDILAVGGAVDPLKAFIKFRGRKPEVDALLRLCDIS
ncbi:MAG: M3 family metallopeptidase [Succinivibrio sp.]|nr:M3 family metallopeptidase [Succinivibrio sp.]